MKIRRSMHQTQASPWAHRYHRLVVRGHKIIKQVTLMWAHTVVRLVRRFHKGSFATVSTTVAQSWKVYAHKISSRLLAFIPRSWENRGRRVYRKLHQSRQALAQQLRGKYNIMTKKKQKKPATLRGFLWRWSKRLAFFAVLAFFVLGGIFFVWVATLEIPETNIDERVIAQSTKIYDASGETLLYDVFKDERRTIVSLDAISPYMQKAIMAIEDDQFYEHNGVRFTAVLRAIYYKLKDPSSRLQGGSTITQQVIKNALLTNDRKIERKVKEWVLAWRIEKIKSKEEIMEIYLNEIPFGGPVYGVEQAARSFYGISASELSVAQSAYLAALPKAPTTYLNNREKFDGRAQYIIKRMRDLGFITAQEYEEAREEEVVFEERDDKGIKAPHFVFYVLEELEEDLLGNEGELHSGGYEIETTLNWELQQKLEEVVAEQAERVADNYRASNLAVVVLENKTGKIVAMVGSKDYFAEDIDGKYNVTTASRQPGSSFKPFVYANAFSQGYIPDTVLWDTQTEFSQACFPDGEPEVGVSSDACYTPQNYDSRFRGPVSLRSALAQSLNIPAVKLLYLAGIGDSMKLAKDLGITTLNRTPSFYGLSLVLGGGEVRMVDMASAYSTFANEGQHLPLSSWQEIRDAEGEVVDEYSEEKEQVVDANVARMINDVLSDNDAKRPMFGAQSSLYYEGRDVAVKTGTTNNYKDVWTAGYSSDVTVVVWAGNNDNTPIASSPSSSVVGPFWRQAMDVALEYYGAQPFRPYTVANKEELKPILQGDYEGSGVVYVNRETGETRDSLSEEEQESGEYEPVGRSSYHSILHYVDRGDVRGPAPLDPTQDGLYEHFEFGVSQWVKANDWVSTSSLIDDLLDSIEDEQNNSSSDSSGDDNHDSSNQAFDFTISQPRSGTFVSEDGSFTVELDIEGSTRKIKTLYYYFNNTYLGSRSGIKTTYRVNMRDVRRVEEMNTLKVVAETTDNRRIERSVTLYRDDM